VITNWGELMGGDDALDSCSAPVHPHHPERGRRGFQLGREVWIERSDYEVVPPKGFFPLYPPKTAADGSLMPGNKVRLKYGHVVECTGGTRDANGRLIEGQAQLVPDTKSGTPGANAVKVKGNITWVAAADGLRAEVRLYERLFTPPQPGSGELLDELNRDSLTVATAWVEPSLAGAAPGVAYQFERHGSFVLDSHGDARVFNRAAGMRDSWGK
jgi:glutaminyl-tRNA synthetase